MDTEKRLYRSRNALVGGVCAGVAEHFDIDPLVVRILTVALSLSTAGMLAVVYAALWVLLPLAPDTTGPVEVEPQYVHSDTYGRVEYGTREDAARAAAEVAAARQQRPYDPPVGVGHVPPEPPAAAAAAWARQAAAHVPPPGWQAPGWQAPGWRVPDWSAPAGGQVPGPGPTVPSGQQGAPSQGAPGAAAVPTAPATATAPVAHAVPATAAPSAHAAPVGPSAPPVHAAPGTPSVSAVPPAPATSAAPPVSHGGGVKVGVLIGALLLFFGIAALLSEYIRGVSWWQFWPLVLAIVGIVQMVVPGEPGHRMAQFVNGLILFFLGGTLLPMSLGVASWYTLELMVASLWPLLLMMVGFFIIAAAVRSPWWTLAAGLCFAAFCVAGILWFAVPGANDLIVFTLPIVGREFALPFELSVLPVR